MDLPEAERRFEAGRPAQKSTAQPPPEHDAAVIAAARSAGERIGRGRSRWPIAVALAAGILLGIAAPQVLLPRPPELTIPARAVTRGSATAPPVPVEQAAPDDWYRYIQELIWAGDLKQAERHLRRFVELHPSYKPARGG